MTEREWELRILKLEAEVARLTAKVARLRPTKAAIKETDADPPENYVCGDLNCNGNGVWLKENQAFLLPCRDEHTKVRRAWLAAHGKLNAYS
jgi:hypothetical protein